MQIKYGKLPKVYSFKRIDSKSISDRILKNSLSFLLEGVEQIEKRPKQSIVSFWTGVELFIKSILVDEHWSLITKDPKSVNHERFQSGDFISIDFSQSIILLENIFNIELDKKTKRAFDTLRRHRNKIVHFTDQEIADKNALELCDIFAEMSAVWEELNGLQLIPIDFDNNTVAHLYDNITNAVENHRVILEGKFRHAYATKLRYIDSKEILQCACCNYKAVILQPVNDILHETTCLVCNDMEDVIKIQCKKCKNVVLLHRSETACTKCNHKIDKITTVFNQRLKMENSIVATCHRCSSKSVIDIDSIWFCLNCYSYHLVNICERCGAYVTHGTKNSRLSGCICCDELDEH